MGRYDRRVAVITGAARGIGFGIAQRLASEGASIAVLDLDEAAAQEAAGRLELAEGARAVGIGCDVVDAAAAEASVQRVVDELGGIHVLVNTAGVTRDNLLFKMTDSDWDVVMHVHLRGSFLMSRAAQKHMIEAKWGRIVNLSSTSALGNRGQVNYAAAKAGLQGFTKTLAIELGKFGVTANAIAPGFIQTEMTKATAERMGVSFDDFIAGAASQIPVARVGQPEDIAPPAAFLCSDEASFITGPTLYVDGGRKLG
jgi:3-oxoacyl-[acyl-carrier protein] reductase